MEIILKRRLLLLLLLTALITMACGLLPGGAVPGPTIAPTTPTPIVESPSFQNIEPTVKPTDSPPEPTPTPTSVVNEEEGRESIAPTWPAPIDPAALFANGPISPAQQAVFDRLARAAPPERNDMELAQLYNGWDGLFEPVPLVDEPLPIGTMQQLNILNRDTITINPITAELLAVSDHAYFWFDTGPGSVRPADIGLSYVTQSFDMIYEQSVAFFGPEDKPGVDGDPRIHIVNASPNALCDLRGDPDARCQTAGYYSAQDGIPASVDPNSNAREMFVMNVELFGSDFYLNVLTHELRHMIEDKYDHGDTDWEAEGSATFAEDLLGYTGSAVSRANLFLAEPDRQLNSWPQENRLPAYGQGYLMNRYIHDRLGGDFYRQFASSPESGLLAVDALAQSNNLEVTAEGLWVDWLAALAIHDRGQTPERYRFGVEGLETATMTLVENYPAEFEETVHQYAADYYKLVGDSEVTIEFSGNTVIPLLDTVPASGESMWLANRANYSHMQLTRALDLTSVPSATLQYSVYHDIEPGYDFGYTFVSEDNGSSWQPLVADFMQGPADDPSDSALIDRFYTGRSDFWRDEQIDLTPFAGKEILLRFAYITDPILTQGGIALDNIAVPEIGYFDDAESAADDWLADGFERVTAAIPQQWHLQLITFEDGVPRVESLPLTGEQALSNTVSLANSGGEAILIVAASAPMTLELAQYGLVIRGK